MWNLNLIVDDESITIGIFTTERKAIIAKDYMLTRQDYDEDMFEIVKCNLELDELIIENQHIRF